MEPYEYERTRQTMHEEWVDYAEKKRAFQKQLKAIQQRNLMEQIERKQTGQTRRQTIATQGGIETTKLDVAGRKDIASMLGEKELRKLVYEHGSPQEAARYRGEAQTLAERGIVTEESRARVAAAEEKRLAESEKYYRDKNEGITPTLTPEVIPTDEEDVMNARKLMRKKGLGIARQF